MFIGINSFLLIKKFFELPGLNQINVSVSFKNSKKDFKII